MPWIQTARPSLFGGYALISGSVGGGSLPDGFYETFFPGPNESPISEGGVWINGAATGIQWSNCGITNNRMHTLMTAPGTEFRDATAVVTGIWSPNQEIITTVSFDFPEGEAGDPHNIEIIHHIRSTVAPNFNAGYTVGYRCGTDSGSYKSIGWWNGPFLDFGGPPVESGDPDFGIDPGDVIRTTCFDDGADTVVTGYKNDVQTLQLVETRRFTTGSPGMGFFHHPEIEGDEDKYLEFGITHFLAQNL